VIGGDAEVRVAVLDHLENGLQYADDGAVGAVFAFGKPTQPVEVTEEFVSAVDEVNDHFASMLIGSMPPNKKFRKTKRQKWVSNTKQKSSKSPVPKFTRRRNRFADAQQNLQVAA
jgi:hypothetical protein